MKNGKTKNKISDEEFDRQYDEASKQTAENPRVEPRAVGAKKAGSRLTVEIESGWSFSFDPRVLPELKTAVAQEATDVKILGAGYTLEWSALDIHLGVGEVIAALLGEAFLRARYASANGRIKSPRRAAASAANGKLGGRPRKADRIADPEK